MLPGSSSRKQQRYRETELPVRPLSRVDHVVVALQIHVEGRPAGLDDLAEATANRDYPAVAAIVAKGFPVSGDDGRGGQIPALGQVVVDEGLNQHRVDPLVGRCIPNRPLLVSQGADYPVFLHGDHDCGRSNAEGIRTQQVVGFRREAENGTDALSDRLGLGRRQE